MFSIHTNAVYPFVELYFYMATPVVAYTALHEMFQVQGCPPPDASGRATSREVTYSIH